MAPPGELAALSSELNEIHPSCRLVFEWSSPSQGKHLLICGDWNRKGKRTSRTLRGRDGRPIKKGKHQLTTTQRLEALEAATTLVSSHLEGSTTKQRRRASLEPSSSQLANQKRKLIQAIRERDGGHGVKSKHLRHARGLFDWLDVRNLLLDCVNTINWAGDGDQRDTDNYADKLRIAKWACGVNGLTWILPPNKRPQKPTVKRPFVDRMIEQDLSELFTLVKDPTAATFLRVIATTGCRPSEVLTFDWQMWEKTGRPNIIDGYSRKKKASFTAICQPMEWIRCIDIALLEAPWPSERLWDSSDFAISDEITRIHSKLLRKVQKDLASAGISEKPDWTDFRHLWTVRAELNGISRRIGAIAQAHSEKMASAVYLRHGERAQVLAEARRIATMPKEESWQ